MRAIKKFVRRDEIATIKVPEEFGEIIEVIILPAEGRDADLRDDLQYFAWDGNDNDEKKAFSSLTANSIKEWKAENEDTIWK